MASCASWSVSAPAAGALSRRAQARRCVAARAGCSMRICVRGDTCRKRGSKELLTWAREMEIEGVSFEETGCTGRCADGPNATIESEGGSYDLMGLRSCRDVAEALSTKCGIEVDATLVSATDCRMAGVTAAMDGDFETAIKYFTKGIELNPPNVHTFYANRAVARLKNKDKSAMEDGQTALELAPEGWAEDWPWNTDISGLITEF